MKYDPDLMEIARQIVERGLYRPDQKPEIERTGVPLYLPLPPPPKEKT